MKKNEKCIIEKEANKTGYKTDTKREISAEIKTSRKQET